MHARMDVVRYKPGEAIRWLQAGAENLRKEAKRQSASLVTRKGERTIAKDIRDAAGAIFGMGKSALAELMHHEAQASEYVLREDRFEVIGRGGSRAVRYRDVSAMKQRGDRVTVVLESGSLTIKPHAYILAGRLKVPIGWSRNGIEVPFETLTDELSARAGVNIENL